MTVRSHWNLAEKNWGIMHSVCNEEGERREDTIFRILNTCSIAPVKFQTEMEVSTMSKHIGLILCPRDWTGLRFSLAFNPIFCPLLHLIMQEITYRNLFGRTNMNHDTCSRHRWPSTRRLKVKAMRPKYPLVTKHKIWLHLKALKFSWSG